MVGCRRTTSSVRSAARAGPAAAMTTTVRAARTNLGPAEARQMARVEIVLASPLAMFDLRENGGVPTFLGTTAKPGPKRFVPRPRDSSRAGIYHPRQGG